MPVAVFWIIGGLVALGGSAAVVHEVNGTLSEGNKALKYVVAGGALYAVWSVVKK